MNQMLISFAEDNRDVMLGIYPSYPEANFIRSRQEYPLQCTIVETNKPITTDKVGDFLRRTRQWWDYNKNVN